MASPMAVPLSLNTAPTTTPNDEIDLSSDLSWQEEEEADDVLGTVNNNEISMDSDAPPDDPCLLDTPDEEQDFGAPLSQQAPSLQWEDTSFNIKNQDKEEEGNVFNLLIPNSESQGTNWDPTDSDDEAEENDDGAPPEIEEDSAAAKKGQKKKTDATFLSLEQVKKEYLSKLVIEAFSTSLFKDPTFIEDQNSDPIGKRQKTSMSKTSSSSSSCIPQKRHICPSSSSNGSVCSP